MMKRVFALMLSLLLILSLAACGGSAGVTVNLEQVKGQMLEAIKESDPLELPAERLTELYGIEQEDLKSAACIITLGGAFPDEIIMTEAVDAAAAKRIAEKLEARLADVTNQAQNYDAESYALLEKCKVQTVGTYVTLFISAENEQLQQIFDAAKQ